MAMCPLARARGAATASAVLVIEERNRRRNAHWQAYNKVMAKRVDRLDPVAEGAAACGCECGNGTDCIQRFGTKRPRSRLMVNAAGEEVWRSPPLARPRPRLARRVSIVGAALFEERA